MDSCEGCCAGSEREGGHHVVLRTGIVVRRTATRCAFLSHVEQDLLVDHGVRVVVRPARFASVNVPARHHASEQARKRAASSEL